MKAETKKWRENFKLELEHIQIQFDSFFAAGKMDDYYTLKRIKKQVCLYLTSLQILNCRNKLQMS